MARLILLLVLLAGCPDPPAPEAPPKAPPGPAEVAKAFMKAYGKRDMAAMRELMRAENREVIEELERDGEKSAHYPSVFAGWRWETARDWDGTLGAIRYGKRHAYVYLADLEELRMVVVAKIYREEGAWRFEDMAQITRTHFEKQLTEEPGDGLR